MQEELKDERGQGCPCKEIGKDGTKHHSRIVAAYTTKFPTMKLIIDVCSNHENNYRCSIWRKIKCV